MIAPSLTIMSSWWAISSLRVRIWESLVFLSSSHFSMVDSRFLISSLSLVASAVTYKDEIELLDFLPRKRELNFHWKKYNLGSGLLDLVDLVVLALDPGVGGINLLLQIILCSLKPVGLVNDFLGNFVSMPERKVSWWST